MLKFSIPLEIHYDLELDNRLPWDPAKTVEDSPGKARSLMPGQELLYLLYKAYVDLIIHKKRKGVK